jgi:hypothetical protein
LFIFYFYFYGQAKERTLVSSVKVYMKFGVYNQSLFALIITHVYMFYSSLTCLIGFGKAYSTT